MSTLYLLNKPFQVLSQFTDSEGRNTLANFIKTPKIYPAGRLDYDSEGLLILTGDGAVQARISDPKHKLPKTYWVQVEGIITDTAVKQLQQGVRLKDGKTKPAKAKKIDKPDVWTRSPPIRERSKAPTSWLELSITEGRNRQVRRMTAEVGFPTLRLIRYSIGQWTLDGLSPGEHKTADIHLPKPSPSTTHSRRKPHNKAKLTRKRNN
ncbi:MAG: 23S rRNA pseudouridine2457 synthase [Oleiphilaceae bacterium]|jgi:23S rRNA pseudouridine2457 synthase